MSHKPTTSSHLSQAQQQGKMYDHKLKCSWCYAAYDSRLSDAMKPAEWCSLRCQIDDENISSAYHEHDH